MKGWWCSGWCPGEAARVGAKKLCHCSRYTYRSSAIVRRHTYVCICQHKNFNNNIAQEQTGLFLQRLLKFVHLSSQDWLDVYSPGLTRRLMKWVCRPFYLQSPFWITLLRSVQTPRHIKQPAKPSSILDPFWCRHHVKLTDGLFGILFDSNDAFTLSNTGTGTDRDTDKLTQNPMRICVDACLCAVWTYSTQFYSTQFLSVSVSVSVWTHHKCDLNGFTIWRSFVPFRLDNILLPNLDHQWQIISIQYATYIYLCERTSRFEVSENMFRVWCLFYRLSIEKKC